MANHLNRVNDIPDARRLLSPVRDTRDVPDGCGWCPDWHVVVVYGAQFVRVRPSQTSKVKRTSYESGLRPFSPKPRLFNIRYYYYAILFVVFDVETVLLFPWAIKYGVLSKQFGVIAFFAVLVFLVVVTLGYLYAWRKGALEWTRSTNN